MRPGLCACSANCRRTTRRGVLGNWLPVYTVLGNPYSPGPIGVTSYAADQRYRPIAAYIDSRKPVPARFHSGDAPDFTICHDPGISRAYPGRRKEEAL